MRSVRVVASIVLLGLFLVGLAACSKQQAPPLKDAVSKALQQAGFNDIRVDEDRDKGVITLNGRVRSPELKAHAEEVAKAAAPGKVVSNQLSIEPVDQESAAKKIESNVDDAIDKSYKAALIANHLDSEGIHFEVKNGVLTLTGRVKTDDIRAQAEKLGTSVPNVSQVVNKLDVKGK